MFPQHVRHHVQRAIEVLGQPCQRFCQTIETLLGNNKIIDGGLGWARPPFSLVVQDKVLENARVVNGFANNLLFHKRAST